MCDEAQIRDWDSALTRCAALLVRSSYRDDISDTDADMLREAVARATRARDGLITRLRAAEARTAWQPIETAPVGVEVMVTWVDRQGLRHMSGGILLGTHWWTHGRVVTPTHWQPLLAPRAAAASR